MKEQTTNSTALTRSLVTGQMFRPMMTLSVLDDSTGENREQLCPIHATVDGSVQEASQVRNQDDASIEEQWDDEGWQERLAQLRAEKTPKRDLLRCPTSRHRTLAGK